jgi:hypothetical protein
MNLRLYKSLSDGVFAKGFFEMEEDGVLGEWETHFGIARTLF